MAAIWKGALAFGLVNIPVELRTAVRNDHISFRMLREEDMSAIKYERVAEADLMSKLRASLDQGGGKSGKAQAKRKSVAAGEKSSSRARKRKTA